MNFHVVGRCGPWALDVPTTTLLVAEQRNLTMGLFQGPAIPNSAFQVPCNQNGLVEKEKAPTMGDG